MFVGVAELLCELPRDETESLRRNRIASFFGSIGEKVMDGRVALGAWEIASDPMVAIKVTSKVDQGEKWRNCLLQR